MNAYLMILAVLVFLGGVLLGAFDPLPCGPKPSKRLAKGVAVMACTYGALMLVGAMLGGANPLHPIPESAFLLSEPEGTERLEFIEVETVSELELLLEQAREQRQPVMFDFTADWCSACKEMEARTFPDPSVIAALQPFTLIRADISNYDEAARDLQAHLGAIGAPMMIFFNRSGERLRAYELVRGMSADELIRHVKSVPVG